MNAVCAHVSTHLLLWDLYLIAEENQEDTCKRQEYKNKSACI